VLGLQFDQNGQVVTNGDVTNVAFPCASDADCGPNGACDINYNPWRNECAPAAPAPPASGKPFPPWVLSTVVSPLQRM
jgi:hypothetical protein